MRGLSAAVTVLTLLLAVPLQGQAGPGGQRGMRGQGPMMGGFQPMGMGPADWLIWLREELNLADEQVESLKSTEGSEPRGTRRRPAPDARYAGSGSRRRDHPGTVPGSDDGTAERHDAAAERLSRADRRDPDRRAEESAAVAAGRGRCGPKDEARSRLRPGPQLQAGSQRSRGFRTTGHGAGCRIRRARLRTRLRPGRA